MDSSSNGRTLDGETRHLLRQAIDARRRELTPYIGNDDELTRRHRVRDSRKGGVETLTVRQLQVVELWAEGLGDKEIAKRLGITKSSAHTFARNILPKLGASTRAQAVAMVLGVKSSDVALVAALQARIVEVKQGEQPATAASGPPVGGFRIPAAGRDGLSDAAGPLTSALRGVRHA